MCGLAGLVQVVDLLLGFDCGFLLLNFGLRLDCWF